ncbi:unnamed protein product [Calypogeia fissa]
MRVDLFKKLIKNAQGGSMKAQNIISQSFTHVSLRRTKDILNLPTKHVHRHTLDWDCKEDKDKYDDMAHNSMEEFKAFKKGHTSSGSVWSILLRLRRRAFHPDLDGRRARYEL